MVFNKDEVITYFINFLKYSTEARYRVLILPTKRASNLFEVAVNSGLLDDVIPNDLFVCTDIFLKNSDIKDFLTDDDCKIAIFDETLRFGRNVTNLVNYLTTTFDVEPRNINVHTMAMYKGLNGKIDCLVDNPIRGADSTPPPLLSLSDLNVLADKALNICYDNCVPYTVGLPKSKPIDYRDQTLLLTSEKIQQMGFSKTVTKKAYEVYFDYYLKPIVNIDELKGSIGFLSVFLDLAYLEAYFFMESGKIVLVPRVNLKPIDEQTIDSIWNLIITDAKEALDMRQKNVLTKFALLECLIAWQLQGSFINSEQSEQKFHLKVDDIDFQHLKYSFGESCCHTLRTLFNTSLGNLSLPKGLDLSPYQFSVEDLGKIHADKSPNLKENGETVNELFSNDEFDDRFSCAGIGKLEKVEDYANIRNPISRRLLSQLKEVYVKANDLVVFCTEYTKALVDGVATSKNDFIEVANGLPVAYKFSYAGEEAVRESGKLEDVYYVISLASKLIKEFNVEDGNKKNRFLLHIFVATELDKQGHSDYLNLIKKRHYTDNFWEDKKDETFWNKVDSLDIGVETNLHLNEFNLNYATPLFDTGEILSVIKKNKDNILDESFLQK